MTDYTNLVKALRCKRDDCEGCDISFFDKDEGWMCQYAAKDDDAADAIEALQAELAEAESQSPKPTDPVPIRDVYYVMTECDVKTGTVKYEPRERSET